MDVENIRDAIYNHEDAVGCAPRRVVVASAALEDLIRDNMSRFGGGGVNSLMVDGVPVIGDRLCPRDYIYADAREPFP